jgi:2-desacetyl-2-hydroxyethyl bacteriochlorophyllide A dehydrogenase
LHVDEILTCVSPGHFEYGVADYPAIQKDHAILKIKRIGICGTDLHAYEGTQPYFSYPRILGHELAGEIVETDDADFKPGDIVTFIPYFHCGTCIACRSGKTNCCASLKVSGVHFDGGMVEYLSVPNYLLVHADGLSVDALALVEPLSIGAHGIRRAEIKPGENVVVIGAGPIGLGTMEFARIAQANVIALDRVESRLNFCREKLSIPHTINTGQANYQEQIREITQGSMPTVVIDATGNLDAIQGGFNLLAHGGRYVLIGLQKGNISFSHPEFHKREATLMSSRNATREDFNHVIQSIKKGLIKPDHYITHRVHFDQVKEHFASWLNPANGVIKAMVQMEG